MQLYPASEQTIAGASDAIRRRERTCVELVSTCLAQIDLWEEKIRAWVSLDRDEALKRAVELDAELGQGHWRSPLHGIPIGIKDLIDVAGCPTAAGAPWLTRSPAVDDAMLVKRLRSAGAIILGKTVTTQFACFDPAVTRNPWNLERTPGGSSSGSAAAVATGMCLGAIGSQTGGSITRPATFCGVAGCKPSFGLVSLKGIYPVSPSLDHAGPIARTVEDLAILLEALVSPMQQMGWRAAMAMDAGSLTELAVACGGPEAPLSPFAPAEQVHLGRLRGLFEERCERSALVLLENTLERLREGGATISEFELPAEFGDVQRCHRTIMTFEIAGHHQTQFAEHAAEYLPCIRGLVEEGLAVAPEEYQRCKRQQELLRGRMQELMRQVPVLICPAATGPAPARDTTGDPVMNSPWSYTGLPTVSVPAALSAEGLPLSIQLVGRQLDEATLFAAALWCEQRLRARY